MIVIIWDGKIKRLEIDKKDWHTLPHAIVKIYDGNMEIFGYGGYFLHDENIRGVNTTKLNGDMLPLETVIKNPDKNLKFGITIPDNKWQELGTFDYK